MEVTREIQEIVKEASSLPSKEMTVLKAFIAGLEAKEKLNKEEIQKAG